MKRTCLSLVCAMAGLGASAAPVVSNVAVQQNAATHGVVATYDLSEDAIVTVVFLTNGVPCEAARHVKGDTWRPVSAGTGCQIAWNMSADLGEENAGDYTVAARVSAWATNAPPAYCVIDLKNAATRRRYYESEEQLPDGIGSDVYRTTKMVLRRIPAAGVTFTMGAPEEETRAAGWWQASTVGAETQHSVTFTKDYYMGVFEVTQAQWIQVIGFIPSTHEGWKMPQPYTNEAQTLPVQSCARNRWLCGEKHQSDSWKGDVDQDGNLGYLGNQTFFYVLRQMMGGQSRHYNLPFEAQWEYACRAGSTAAFSDGRGYDAAADYSDIAVYNTSRPERVGSKKPNAWGLYDMHGNVGEAVLDNVKQNGQSPVNEDTLYATDATDPHGYESGFNLVGYRGGEWDRGAGGLRCAARRNGDWWGANSSVNGFRVAVPADEL